MYVLYFNFVQVNNLHPVCVLLLARNTTLVYTIYAFSFQLKQIIAK